MPSDFGKKCRLKWGDTKPKEKSDLTATETEDEKNMHHPSEEGNFCDQYGNALKPETVQEYNRHTGYAEKSDHITITPLRDTSEND